MEKLAMLKYIAPLAKALDGNLTTAIQLEGQLNDDLTPNLSTIAGDAIANICSPSEIKHVVTDKELSEHFSQSLTSEGIELVMV